MLPIDQDSQSKQDFERNLRYCWKMLNLYHKKQEDYTGVFALFYSIIKDQPGFKLNRALQVWLKENNNFPTPADILRISKSMQFDFTKEELKHREMHQLATSRKLGLHISEAKEERLEEYERKFGMINTSQKWEKSYDMQIGGLNDL